jgi:ComF family protein
VKNFYIRLKNNQTKQVFADSLFKKVLADLGQDLHARLKQILLKAEVCILCGGTLAGRQKAHAQTNHDNLGLCASCIDDLPFYSSPYYAGKHCPQCALPTTTGEHCGRCLQHPPAFDITYAVFKYAYPLDKLLHQYKYQQQLSYAPLLTSLVVRSNIQANIQHESIDAVIAMPMHINRLRERGFNHMHTLAQHLNQTWQWSMPMDACVRVKDTPTQAGLNLKQRITNLKGAFETRQDWQGKHILLLDDVMTTGSSLNALAKVFRQAGASKISCLVLARTLKPEE